MGKAQGQFLVDLIIGQLDPHGGKIVLRGVDIGVDLPLCPVFGGLFPRDGGGGKSRGLDLVHGRHAVRGGKDTVGTALDGIVHLGGNGMVTQKHLGFVVGVFCCGGAL